MSNYQNNYAKIICKGDTWEVQNIKKGSTNVGFSNPCIPTFSNIQNDSDIPYLVQYPKGRLVYDHADWFLRKYSLGDEHIWLKIIIDLLLNLLCHHHRP